MYSIDRHLRPSEPYDPPEVYEPPEAYKSPERTDSYQDDLLEGQLRDDGLADELAGEQLVEDQLPDDALADDALYSKQVTGNQIADDAYADDNGGAPPNDDGGAPPNDDGGDPDGHGDIPRRAAPEKGTPEFMSSTQKAFAESFDKTTAVKRLWEVTKAGAKGFDDARDQFWKAVNTLQFPVSREAGFPAGRVRCRGRARHSS